MSLCRLILVLALALGIGMPAFSGAALARPKSQELKKHKKAVKAKKRVAKKAIKAKKGRKSRLVCRGKGKTRKCRRSRGRFAGHGVAMENLRIVPLPKATGWVSIFSPNFQEELRINIYNEDGSLNEGSLAQLDRLFRCRRTKEERAVDPRLYEILAILNDHFEGRRIFLTSGFRFQRNEGSRHFHASAMDISVDGISYKELYQFAETLDRGGMGIGQYPNDGFVHIDFRAPGEPSYRWTDTTRSGNRAGGKAPSLMWQPRASKSNS